MSEHTPLTEAEENVVEFVRTFETGEAAANALPIMFRAMNAARMASATADTEGCWQPCDPDCEVGPVHCEAVHLPSHKAQTVLHSADCLDAAVREAEQRVASAFVEWAMKNEVAEPPLDWAWFGEITRRYWPHHPEYRADRIPVDAPEGGEGR